MSEGPEGTARSSLPERILATLPGLTRFVRDRMGPNLRARESASDIVQSTIRSVLQSQAAFEDCGEASFQAWLRTAARNKLATRARYWGAGRRGGTPMSHVDGGAASDDALSAAPLEDDPSQQAQLREDVERLRRTIAALPADQRDLLIRSQVHGQTHAEIARQTGRAPEAVRKSVARALVQLAAGLEP